MSTGSTGNAGNMQAVTVSDAALKAVAANAIRHLTEADQHYKAGRYPSAMASAVLSIEEAGKLSFLTLQRSAPKGKRHAAHAIMFVAMLAVFQTWGWAIEWRAIIRGEENPSDLGLSAQQQKDVAAHPEFAEFVRRVQAGELADLTERNAAWVAAVTAKEQREGSLQKWEPLFANGLQWVRLKATYVDVTSSGDAWNDPNALDGDFAKFMCTGAVGFLILMLLVAVNTRKSLEVRDLLDSVPDDVTGMDTLRKLFPSLSARAAAAIVAEQAAA